MFVWVPIILVSRWLEPDSKVAALLILIATAIATNGYTSYCHGRFGQTIGKWVMRIRVVRTTGEPIGWREAWLRESILLLF